MGLFSEFFLYAIVFRLAIIAAGTVSIILGYRLFTIGSQTENETSRETTFDAKMAGLEFALKNAAPGTFFALFGVIIISVMLVQGNPELTLKSFSGAQRAAGLPVSSELALRGGAPATAGRFDDAVQRGLEYDRKSDTANAVASYEEAMTAVATPMNQLAWDYLQQGKAESALPLSRFAVQLCPGKAPFLDTLAEILLKEGERDEALKWMEKAAALDPKYQRKLSDFQRAAKR
jgi:tetratricopeptide (TPR) repeat protein